MLVYKICTQELWRQTQATGVFAGMPIDVADGYVHLSTAEQNAETARKYFAGKSGLMLLSVDTEKLPDGLRWEPSSSGNRPGDFPHFYGQLPLAAVVEAKEFSVPAMGREGR